MHCLTLSSSSSSSFAGIVNEKLYYDNPRTLSRIQSQISSHVLVNRTPPAVIIVPNNRGKITFCKTNRANYPRNYCVKQEREAQLIQGNEDISNKSIKSSSSTSSILSFLCPLLKLFSARDPSGERNYLLEEVTSSLSSLARFPWGSRSIVSDGLSDQEILDPPLRLQLFEFEACPFCRRVREAITELDLSVEIYPCPKGSVRHREMVKRLGGKEQFPFLVDPNTGTSMYESGDIVKYLYQQYGGKRDPSFGILESTLVTGWIPTLLRAGRGMTFWENSVKEAPLEKLELFSYENNSYARIVREALCELELPYILHSVGQRSKRAKLLAEMSGSDEVPYLVDRNTGTEIGGYKKIISYLFQIYSCANTLSEL